MNLTRSAQQTDRRRVRVTCTLIDWGARKVRLPPDAETEVPVIDDEINAALVHHRQREDAFTPKEAQIRDTFDRFLDGMELFAATYTPCSTDKGSARAPVRSFFVA